MLQQFNTVVGLVSALRNMQPRFTAFSMVLVMAIVPIMTPSVSHAQPAGELTAPRIGWADGQRVFHVMEQWVKRGTAETHAEDPQIRVSDLLALKITLRWNGQTMGDGEAFSSEVADVNGAVNVIDVARLAMQRALAGVRSELRRRNNEAQEAQRLRDTSNDVEPKAGIDIAFEDIQDFLVPDLQLGHSPVRIEVAADADRDEIERHFTPGYHGLILTPVDVEQGLTKRSTIWPASMLAGNYTPRNQIRTLISRSGLSPITDVSEIARPQGAQVERFSVIHIVRPRPLMPVEELVRGNILLKPALDEATLDNIADRLAAHLELRMRKTEPRHRTQTNAGDNNAGNQAFELPAMGTYLPTMDDYNPRYADAEELALMAYALGRRVRVLQQLGVGGEKAAQAMTASRRALEKAQSLLNNLREDESPSPVAMGLMVMAIIESPHLNERKEQRDQLAATLFRLQEEDGAFLLSPLGDGKQVTATDQAILAAAMAMLYRQTRDDLSRQAAQLARDQAWRMFQSRPRQQSLPWLMICEQYLPPVEDEAQRASDDMVVDTRAERIVAVQAIVNRLQEQQIRLAPSPQWSPADVIGGFDDGTSPDWQTAASMAFMASALRDETYLPKDQQAATLLSCSQAGRFIGQLMFDDPSCYYISDVDFVRGAVRSSLSNNVLKPHATSYALLAACELQQTLHHLKNR